MRTPAHPHIHDTCKQSPPLTLPDSALPHTREGVHVHRHTKANQRAALHRHHGTPTHVPFLAELHVSLQMLCSLSAHTHRILTGRCSGSITTGPMSNLLSHPQEFTRHATPHKSTSSPSVSSPATGKDPACDRSRRLTAFSLFHSRLER